VYVIAMVRQYCTETITKAFKSDTKKMHTELKTLDVQEYVRTPGYSGQKKRNSKTEWKVIILKI
jgi:hypothetical protein